MGSYFICSVFIAEVLSLILELICLLGLHVTASKAEVNTQDSWLFAILHRRQGADAGTRGWFPAAAPLELVWRQQNRVSLPADLSVSTISSCLFS